MQRARWARWAHVSVVAAAPRVRWLVVVSTPIVWRWAGGRQRPEGGGAHGLIAFAVGRWFCPLDPLCYVADCIDDCLLLLCG